MCHHEKVVICSNGEVGILHDESVHIVGVADGRCVAIEWWIRNLGRVLTGVLDLDVSQEVEHGICFE